METSVSSRTPFLGTRQDLATAQRAFCSWSDPLAAAKAVLQYDKLMAKDPTATRQHMGVCLKEVDFFWRLCVDVFLPEKTPLFL